MSITRRQSAPNLTSLTSDTPPVDPTTSGSLKLSPKSAPALMDSIPVQLANGKQFSVRLWERGSDGIKRYLQFDPNRITALESNKLQDMAQKVMGAAGENIKFVSLTFADKGQYSGTTVNDQGIRDDNFSIDKGEAFDALNPIKTAVHQGLSDNRITHSLTPYQEYEGLKTAIKNNNEPGKTTVFRHADSRNHDIALSCRERPIALNSKQEMDLALSRLTKHNVDGTSQQLDIADLQLYWHYYQKASSTNSETLLATDGSILKAKEYIASPESSSTTTLRASASVFDNNNFIREARALWNSRKLITQKPNLLKIQILCKGHFVGLYLVRKANGNVDAYFVDSLKKFQIKHRLGITDDELKGIIKTIVSNKGSEPEVNLRKIYTHHQDCKLENHTQDVTNGTECGVLQLFYGRAADQVFGGKSSNNNEQAFKNALKYGDTTSLDQLKQVRENMATFIETSNSNKIFNAPIKKIKVEYNIMEREQNQLDVLAFDEVHTASGDETVSGSLSTNSSSSPFSDDNDLT